MLVPILARFIASAALAGATAAPPSTQSEVAKSPAIPATSARELKPPKQISLLSEDEHPFLADFYAPEGAATPYPIVLVVPNLSRDRKSLGEFPAQLASRGYGVLVMDNTAQARNIVKVKGRMKFNELRVKDFDRYILDLKAAAEALRRQPGADTKRFGLVGVGLGANIGLLYASQTPEVGTAAFLLPGYGCPGYDSSDLLIRYGQRPALLANSQSKNETDFASAFDTLTPSVRGGPREHRVFPLKAIGAGENEISGHEGLDSTVIDWLDRTLPKPSHP